MRPVTNASLHAGILHPSTPHRCIHCSLTPGTGCRCGAPTDDRRRPDLETAIAFHGDWMQLGGTWSRTHGAA